MSKLKNIANKLSLFTVFRGILNKDIFKYFIEYSKSNDLSNKLNSYGKFVQEIYLNEANLSLYVCKLLFEDENVFVKKYSKDEIINPNILNSVKFELEVLKEFILLSSNDFKEDLNLEYLPEYDIQDIDIVSEYYNRLDNIHKYGYGIYASNPMFSVTESGQIIPIISADKVKIESFIGYNFERQKVVDNTLAFLENRPAANALLYGDAGTGKSSTVKAIVNEYFDDGLRLIEVRKNQLLLLPIIMGEISNNPLKFIIFIDDLTFTSNDDNFGMLKAMLEGSASAQAKNAIIYATSNRRHIVKETFEDRQGNDIHKNDTIQENLSLSERFGLRILFAKPEKKLYLEIVNTLAKRNNIQIDEKELETKAEAFALSRGYRSARCAEQFIESLM